MRRWAFNLFCLVSLMIFAGSVTLWVRGYFVFDRIERATVANKHRYLSRSGEHAEAAIMSASGSLYIYRTSWGDPTAIQHSVQWRYIASNADRYAVWPPLRFRRYVRKVSTFASPSDAVSAAEVLDVFESLRVSLWLFLPFGIPPVVWWRKRRKNRGRGFPVQAGEPNAGGT